MYYNSEVGMKRNITACKEQIMVVQACSKNALNVNKCFKPPPSWTPKIFC
jgi:hypothetical protein